MIFKCKMCGGNLDVNEKSTVGTCQYCGSTMTLPKASDEKKANLFNRANHYRRNNDFDKAMATYENILNEDNNDAEAHWGVVLCKYGIEYVEDPKTKKRIPTCHRAQYGSILADEDYKQALANADDQAKLIYEQEAKAIEGIQKQILEISAKEEPFDVFICYKETSETGSRTKDSVIAQDIYYHLTEAGYKVFFSRITLEDKLGTAYEPYIFAALNSSKVMVVVGTKPEHFNATWTKNEWSRYLSLIKGGAKKILIPAYKDMDPYDLPEEFSHLQAQDMGKIGFIQDMTRGIEKVIRAWENVKKGQDRTLEDLPSPSSKTKALLDRATYCIEDGEFTKADELLELVLNLDPKNVQAYVGKLLIEFKLRNLDSLTSLREPIQSSPNFQKIIRFADADTQKEFNAKVELIVKLIEEDKLEHLYSSSINSLKYGRNLPPNHLRHLYKNFISLGDYKDSKEQADMLKEIIDTKKENEKKAIQKGIKIGKSVVVFSIIAVLAVLGYLVVYNVLAHAYGNKIEVFVDGRYSHTKIEFTVNSWIINSGEIETPFTQTIYRLGSVDSLKVRFNGSETYQLYSCKLIINDEVVYENSDIKTEPYDCAWSR